jgi:hypothetical protein
LLSEAHLTNVCGFPQYNFALPNGLHIRLQPEPFEAIGKLNSHIPADIMAGAAIQDPEPVATEGKFGISAFVNFTAIHIRKGQLLNNITATATQCSLY